MHRLFVTNEQFQPTVKGKTFLLHMSEAHYHHLFRVTRLQVRDQLYVCTPTHILTTEICGITDQGFEGKILASMPAKEAGPDIILAQCLPKSDKMSDILRSCTELGVSSFVPVISERTISRPEDGHKKIVRWQSVVESAAVQSHRSYIPTIAPITGLRELEAQIYKSKLRLAFWENELNYSLCDLVSNSYLNAESSKTPITILIGPEGGLSDRDIDHLRKLSFIVVGLDTPVLRVEHAGLVAISQVMALLSTMG